jgi:energy-coupling factor transporter ATP-binding protein EcfA2
MTAMMGPSGSGKTTLLDILAGRKTAGKHSLMGSNSSNWFEAVYLLSCSFSSVTRLSFDSKSILGQTVVRGNGISPYHDGPFNVTGCTSLYNMLHSFIHYIWVCVARQAHTMYSASVCRKRVQS